MAPHIRSIAVTVIDRRLRPGDATCRRVTISTRHFFRCILMGGWLITVSECCLIKFLLYLLFEKYIYILALEMASRGTSTVP